MKTANQSSAHRISIYPKFLGIPVVITPPRRRTTLLAWLFAALALSCLAPATAMAQTTETFPNPLDLGLATDIIPDLIIRGDGNNGNLILDNQEIIGDKIYYRMITNQESRTGSIRHRQLDTLLNNGADTLVTQEGAHNGIDDERSVIINGYTLILPTIAEFMSFKATSSSSPLLGSGDYQAANRRYDGQAEHQFYNAGANALATVDYSDGDSVPTIFQVRRPPITFNANVAIPNQTYPANTIISVTLPIANGSPPLSYTLTGATPLPSTLTFSGASTLEVPAERTISGTPVAVFGTSGSAILTYTAFDAAALTISLTFTVTVVDVDVVGGGTVDYYSDLKPERRDRGQQYRR